MRKTSWFAVLAVALLSISPTVPAQEFPVRPVRIIVPFSPGGITDVSARLIGGAMSKPLGQQVIVENKPGADGVIAARYVAREPANGYTLYFNDLVAVGPLFIANDPILPGKDLVAVGDALEGAMFLFARSKLPTKWPDVLAFAKSRPGKINVGVPAKINEVAMQVVRARTGMDFTVVPYKGTRPLAVALLGGDVDLAAATVNPTIIQNLQNGSFSALFTASSRRFPLLPDVPTASEAGLSGFNVVFHTGFWTAPGTPAAVIKRLSTEITAAVRLPEVVDAIRKTGTDTSGTTPEEQMRNLDEEIKFWTEATRLANYQPQ